MIDVQKPQYFNPQRTDYGLKSFLQRRYIFCNAEMNLAFFTIIADDLFKQEIFQLFLSQFLD